MNRNFKRQLRIIIDEAACEILFSNIKEKKMAVEIINTIEQKLIIWEKEAEKQGRCQKNE